MPRAVSDSSVLIHLGAIGRLDLLPKASLVLLEAKQTGRLPSIRPLLAQLSGSGFYLDPAFLARILAQAGE